MSLASSLAHARMRNHFHACAFVNGADEERALIEPFLLDGLRRREKAVYIVAPDRRDEHERRLRAKTSSPELVDVTTWREAHLEGGAFDQDRMTASLEEKIREHAAAGQPPTS